MHTMDWLRRTAEYLLGTTLVLAYLARAGRGLRVTEALAPPRYP